MQTCGYCGRENQDDALNCTECGTELSVRSESHPPPEAETGTPSRINLDQLEGAFTAHEGFSRPCWAVIFKALRCHHTPEGRLAGWTDVVAQWASRWETELGNEFWMTQSGACFLVSALDGEAAEGILH